MSDEITIKIIGREFEVKTDIIKPPKIIKSYGVIGRRHSVDEVVEYFETKLMQDYSRAKALPEKTVCLVYKTKIGLEGVLTDDYRLSDIDRLEIELRLWFKDWFRRQKKSAKTLLLEYLERECLDSEEIFDEDINKISEEKAKNLLEQIKIAEERKYINH